jgi:hypothetical protein
MTIDKELECPSCKVPAGWEYIGEQEMDETGRTEPMYNCLGCTTSVLDSTIRKYNTPEPMNHFERRFTRVL